MDNPTSYRWQVHPIPISMLVLVLLVFFTICIFSLPYIGLYFNPSNGQVLFIHDPNHSALQLGDKLIKVGDISFNEYKENFNQPLFTNEMKPDDIVPITINRNGTEQNISWQMPGFSPAEFRGRLFNIWWLSYIFWIFGTCVEAFIRPREVRWWLLLFANHLTGLWLMFGSFSSWHLWGASVLFHAVTWLLLPIYLHLNWIFPKPLSSLQKIAVILFYAISLLLFFIELIQALPENFYAFAFIIALGGSILLQIVHFIRQPQQRKQIRLLVIATVLASLPLITLILLSIFSETPPSSPVVLLSLLLIPATYLYLIFQNQLGGLEIRVNLFISAFAFLIIAGTILIILIQLTALLPAETSALLAFIIPLLSVVLSIHFFPRFQKYVEKNILGVKLDYQNIQEAYSSRIITSTSIPSLLQLLEEEVFPSLFIRQYAFVQVENNHLKSLLIKNISPTQLPEKEAMQELILKSGKYLPSFSSDDDWLRLILPLKMDDTFLGFFLLGRRDPDDFYHLAEIPVLQSIANQTAIALSNILQAETLKHIYQSGIERYEQERLRLAHELHDSVLNELGDLRRNLSETDLSPNIQTSYQEVADRLREIVNDLRPPMLTYGLAPAIKSLAENLMQKTGDKVKIKVELQTTDERIAENIELHLFRIVQEACKNSLSHAKASIIKITGSLSPQKVDLLIEDNGIGFEIKEQLELDNILANRHFGLAGIMERTYLIGTKPIFQSHPNTGTKIQILWAAEKS